MDIVLSETADRAEIITALHRCTTEDAVCCTTETLFLKAKKLLIEEKRKNVTIQLLDEDGYAIRQVSSKPKSAAPKDQLSGRQVAVIRALEKVLKHCRQEGIQLVGYSDELVAMPAHIPVEEISSAGALDVNCYDVYKGADAIAPESAL